MSGDHGMSVNKMLRFTISSMMAVCTDLNTDISGRNRRERKTFFSDHVKDFESDGSFNNLGNSPE